MSTMQYFTEQTCPECKDVFSSASSLLKHFAMHVRTNLQYEYNNESTQKSYEDIYLIDLKEGHLKFENESDSGVEDVNPLKYCLVTLEENDSELRNNSTKTNCLTIKKYQCSFCEKRFGWSTDLKRHLLIHTGERPFKCDMCESSFTRKFLLQKHLKKTHNEESKTQLKPIFSKEKHFNIDNSKSQKCNFKNYS